MSIFEQTKKQQELASPFSVAVGIQTFEGVALGLGAQITNDDSANAFVEHVADSYEGGWGAFAKEIIALDEI